MSQIDIANPDDGPSRFPLLSNDQMTAAQKELASRIRSGPRANVAGSAANSATLGSPFNVFLRSPELGDHLQNVGYYIRFKSVLTCSVVEFECVLKNIICRVFCLFFKRSYI